MNKFDQQVDEKIQCIEVDTEMLSKRMKQTIVVRGATLHVFSLRRIRMIDPRRPHQYRTKVGEC